MVVKRKNEPEEPRYTYAELAVEIARVTGRKCSESAVRKAETAGRITKRADGRFGPESVSGFSDSRRGEPGPGRHRAGADSEDPEGEAGERNPKKDLQHWRLIGEKEKALKARLERRALQETLVKRDSVESAAAERAALVRDRFRQIGPKLAPALAAESDVRRCRDMVCKAVDAALEELTAEVDGDG